MHPQLRFFMKKYAKLSMDYHQLSLNTHYICSSGYGIFVARDGGESYIEARYGEGSGQVILDDVTCTGNESSLAECDHREPFTSNCEHDEDVSVRCFLSNTNTTAGKSATSNGITWARLSNMLRFF